MDVVFELILQTVAGLFPFTNVLSSCFFFRGPPLKSKHACLSPCIIAITITTATRARYIVSMYIHVDDSLLLVVVRFDRPLVLGEMKRGVCVAVFLCAVCFFVPLTTRVHHGRDGGTTRDDGYDDVYRPVRASKPRLTSAEWLGGGSPEDAEGGSRYSLRPEGTVFTTRA